jgi:hypothetical protein
LLDFKREFAPDDVLKVWESIWAAQRIQTGHFPIFIVIAIFVMHKQELLQCTDFSQIMNLLSEIQKSSSMDAADVLARARALVERCRPLVLPPVAKGGGEARAAANGGGAWQRSGSGLSSNTPDSPAVL